MSSNDQQLSSAPLRRAVSCRRLAGSLAAVWLLACGGKTQQALPTAEPSVPDHENPKPSQTPTQPNPRPGDMQASGGGPSQAVPPDEPNPPTEVKPLPDPPACAGDAAFGEPVPLVLDTGFSIAGASLSDDGLELIVGARLDAETADTNAFDLMRAVRSEPGADFGDLVPIEELNSASLERSPTLTADGLTIYFESNRSGESSDIYVADRPQRGAPFGQARLAQPVSTKRHDVPGAVSRFSNSLYFSADRLDGPGRENIYQAGRQDNDAFGETLLISSIDSDSSNVAPAPSSDELTLYFSSNRDSTDLAYKVYRARRKSHDVWYSVPVAVPELSSNLSDRVAWLSADECSILLTREPLLGTGPIGLFRAER